VPFDGIKLNPPQGNTMKDNTVIANLSSLSNHHSHTVVDHQPLTDGCAGVDFDARQKA